MVFESLVTDLLNKYLGEYVENLDSSQLKVGIWGGDVVLENLILKQSALDELDLPVKTLYGRLGKLTLKIPWKRLYTDPVIASVDTLYLLVVPNQDIKYDAAKEEKYLQEAKLAEIKKVEEAKRIEAEKDKISKQNDTFAERISAQIIKNVQISIENIHIRYEDKYSNPGKTFSIGITLNSLKMQSIASWGDPENINPENLVFKELSISNLAVYWNSKSDLLSSDLTQNLEMPFQKGICTNAFSPTDYKYILGPINASSKLRMNMKPEFDGTDFRVPKILLKMELHKLSVCMSKAQYQDLMSFLETIDYKQRGIKFRKYRPNFSSYRNHYKEWWHFAYTCVLEEDVKRRRRNWDWLQIKSHRDCLKTYRKAYQTKLSSSKPASDVVKQCTKLEQQLDALNIVLVRQQVEFEVKREEKLTRPSTTWFGKWWYGSSTQEDSPSSGDIRKQLENAITPEEKAKLYRAIDYKEGDVPAQYPVYFVDTDVSLILHCLQIEIYNEDILVPKVLLLTLNNVSVGLQQRSSAKAMAVNTLISSFTITGCEQNSITPLLVLKQSKASNKDFHEMNETEDHLLQVFFETNPLDKTCDQRIQVFAEPLNIIYDAVTINNIVNVFDSEKQPALVQQIQAAAQMKLAEMKEMSTAGLQHLIQQHSVLNVELNVKSSRILIPKNGYYEKQKQSLIVINLGNLKMTSKLRDDRYVDCKDLIQKYGSEEAALHSVIERSYDNFSLTLTDIQVLYALVGENWEGVITNDDLYFLKPTTLTLNIGKCIIPDDPRLPKIKLQGTGSIHFTFVENRLLDFLELIMLMPLPKSKKTSTEENLFPKYDSTASLASLNLPIKSPKKQPQQSSETDDGSVTQFKELEFDFEMKELSVEISRTVKGDSKPLLLFKLISLEINLYQQTFDLIVRLRLGGASLVQSFQSEKLCLINTEMDPGKNIDLFQVDYCTVQRQSPEFHSKYGSVLQLIEANFSSLDVYFHCEGMLELLQWANTFTEAINNFTAQRQELKNVEESIPKQRKSSFIKRSLLDLSETSRRRKARRKPQHDVIDLKVSVHLSELRLRMGGVEKDLLSFGITGGDGTVVLRKAYTMITARLKGIELINLQPTLYSKVITLVDANEALTATIVLFNEVTKATGSVNMSVKGNIACLQFVFVNKFLASFLDFFDHFQAAQQKLVQASQAAAEAARQNVQDVYANAVKIELDFNLKAPIIVVPLSEKSPEAFVLDLGYLTLNNTFIEIRVPKSSEPAILDRIKVDLENMKMSRVLFDSHMKIIQEYLLLKPVSFNVTVQRNLSSGWFSEAPDLEVGCKLHSIHLSLCREDFLKLMQMLDENIGQVAPKKASAILTPLATPTTLMPKQAEYSISNIIKEETSAEILGGSTAISRETVFTKMKFAFNLESVIIELFQGADAKAEQGLATFTLYVISIKGSMLSDDSLHVSMLLLDCIIDDTRPSQINKINRYMERKKDEEISADVPTTSSPEHAGPRKSMIDITFQQKKNAMFADVRVCSFILIMNIQHLLEISELFTIPVKTTAKALPGITPPVEHRPSKAIVHAKTSTVIVPSLVSVPPPNSASAKTIITFNFKCEHPDIILVENLDDINTNALVLHAEITFKLRTSGSHQVVSGSLNDFQLFSCCYNPLRRQETKVPVLHPLSVVLAGSTPENSGLHLDLSTTAIKIRVSPGSIQLISSVATALMGKVDQKLSGEAVDTVDRSNMWKVEKYNDVDYYFLKTELGEEAFEVHNEGKISEDTHLSELCVFTVPTLLITVEIGVGTNTVPMILVETSIQASIRDWSSLLNVESQLTLEVCYYNNLLALWEPLVEPVDTKEGKKTSYLPWELFVQVETNPEAETLLDYSIGGPAGSSPEAKGGVKPLMYINVSSKETLPITITKTCMEVLNNLSNEFSKAIYKQATFIGERAQFIIKNDSGLSITLLLNKEFKIFSGKGTTSAEESINEVVLDSGAVVELNAAHVEDVLALDSIRKFSTTTNKHMTIKINQFATEIVLPVDRADKRYFKLKTQKKDNVGSHESWGIVSEITSENGSSTITLRGIIQIKNHFQIPISVYYMTSKGNEVMLVGTVGPSSTLNLPLEAIYAPTSELFFSVEGYSVTVKPFVWKDLQNSLEKTELLQCKPKNIEDKEPFFLRATGELEQVYYELTKKFTMASTCYNIHVRPTVIFKNVLPVKIICCIQGVFAEHLLNPGAQIQVPTAEPGSSSLVVRIPDYLDREWSGKKEILETFTEMSPWVFECYETPNRITLDLGLHVLKSSGTLIMSLFCPFWMLNKTGLMLTYRQADETNNVLYHPENFKGPIMFTFKGKSFYAKKKSQIKVEDSSWSEKFSLDVAGSSGVVKCETNTMKYQIGISIHLTSTALTKQITFTPYYVLINNFPLAIEYQEVGRPNVQWIKLESKECAPFWPCSKHNEGLNVRIAGTSETVKFPYDRGHNSLLKLHNKFGALNVDVQISDGGVCISIYAYEPGMAPALIINNTDISIDIYDKSKRDSSLILQRNEQVLFTWESVEDFHVLTFANGAGSVNLRQDEIGQAEINKKILYWSSFLYGFQRVLLFTRVSDIASEAQNVGQHDTVTQKLEISIHGICLSLVNNVLKTEVLHLGVTSTGIKWEAKKLSKKRYKALSARESAAIEQAYNHYVQALSIGEPAHPQVSIDNRIVVDFALNQMIKPVRRDIKRAYDTGLWIQMSFSKHMTQLHAKINRIQIDNQQFDCIFPVVLSPVSPPKSMHVEAIPKPFVEVSIVKRLAEHSIVDQFKYFAVLIQEFHVKVDIGFVNAMVKFLESKSTLEDDQTHFKKDLELVDKPLEFYVSMSTLQEQKNFYDHLHFSPIKIHVSFSLSGGASSSEESSMPPFLNLLMQSFGVTLTDVQDVVFKLSYFQRQYKFLTQRQLVSETQTHYLGQFLKQLYVLVLGLDVIGNPFGLVIGLGQGAADLFYEPFQGAIQGPGEFAEGLIIGMRSLVGHTVGGAAGAVSKITGAMGKGLAALTFDKEYQRHRREMFSHQPANLQEGLAQSGKGLVMGVVDGVTGVITKPITGARDKGVEGFFKGVGKGMVGLVTRPTAGLIDFASGSFSAVKKATDISEETARMRLPRPIRSDGLVRPFSKIEAEGHKILQDLEKGKYAATDSYVYHLQMGSGKQKDILLLTDKRLAYLCLNEIFGGYQIEWSHTWLEVSNPKIVSNGVSIATEKKKGVRGFFSANECGKILLIDKQEKRELILHIIQEQLEK
ncbi:vacuolar protein sorting 13C isoform X2 [Rhodnius prolixus]|uniref:vacuolar protein sorting 13C isoform X2 n=1 Tax=Rhodnius prolixus TaxID=13249 RepID=UPI003D18DEEA